MRTIISQLPNRRNHLRGRYTVEIGYPWLSYGAIIAIEGGARPEHNILELGCGGSTIFWSKRCKSVRSYDVDSKWVEKVLTALPASHNVTFVCGNNEALINAIKDEPNEYYDWVLSDIGRTYEFRLAIQKEAVPKLKRGGYLIVDNYEEKSLMKFDYTGWDVYTFDDLDHHGRGTRICIKT